MSPIRQIIITIGFAFVVSIQASCQTIVEGVGIYGLVWIGMDRSEVKSTLGKDYDNLVEKTTISCLDCRKPKTVTKYVRSKKQWTYRVERITIIFEKNKVRSIYFTGSNQTTTRNIAVGDSTSQVHEKYGVNMLSSSYNYGELGISFTEIDGVVGEIKIYEPIVFINSP